MDDRYSGQAEPLLVHSRASFLEGGDYSFGTACIWRQSLLLGRPLPGKWCGTESFQFLRYAQNAADAHTLYPAEDDEQHGATVCIVCWYSCGNCCGGIL